MLAHCEALNIGFMGEFFGLCLDGFGILKINVIYYFLICNPINHIKFWNTIKLFGIVSHQRQI